MKFRLRKSIQKLFYKSNGYYSKGYYHHKSFDIYNNINSLCNFFSCGEKETLQTKIPIFLNKDIEFGSNFRIIKSKLGAPNYKFKRTVNQLGFNILIYRMYLGGYKTKHEIHLYENNLYYFNYIFSYLNNSEKENLKEMLCKKYFQKNRDLKDKVVIDLCGNKLFITEDVDFTIHYLTGDPKIPKQFFTIRETNRIMRKKIIEQTQEELLSKL